MSNTRGEGSQWSILEGFAVRSPNSSHPSVIWPRNSQKPSNGTLTMRPPPRVSTSCVTHYVTVSRFEHAISVEWIQMEFPNCKSEQCNDQLSCSSHETITSRSTITNVSEVIATEVFLTCCWEMCEFVLMRFFREIQQNVVPTHVTYVSTGRRCKSN